MTGTLTTGAAKSGRSNLLELVGDALSPVELLGVAIDPLTTRDIVDTIAMYVEERRPRHVVTVNLDFLRLASASSDFEALLNAADLAVADGMPLVWASKLSGAPIPERTAGVDLVEELCRRGSVFGWSVFLLGAGQGIAQAASEEMCRRHPGLRVAGIYSPPVGVWNDVEEQRIRNQIRQSNPDLLLVALGAPRQDVWIAENKERLGVPVSMGVGCTFDVLAGTSRRAPRWMQGLGLEWAFRLGREPRRLWRRYVLHDMPTFGRLMVSVLGSRRPKRASRRSNVMGGGVR